MLILKKFRLSIMAHQWRISLNVNFPELTDGITFFVGDRRMYTNFAGFMKAMIIIFGKNKDLQVSYAGGGVFTPEEIKMCGEYSSRVHLLEAFACECPVVCSNSSSLPEAARDAGEYLTSLILMTCPQKFQEWLRVKLYAIKWKDQGRKILELFDWDKAVCETLDC